MLCGNCCLGTINIYSPPRNLSRTPILFPSLSRHIVYTIFPQYYSHTHTVASLHFYIIIFAHQPLSSTSLIPILFLLTKSMTFFYVYSQTLSEISLISVAWEWILIVPKQIEERKIDRLREVVLEWILVVSKETGGNRKSVLPRFLIAFVSF